MATIEGIPSSSTRSSSQLLYARSRFVHSSPTNPQPAAANRHHKSAAYVHLVSRRQESSAGGQADRWSLQQQQPQPILSGVVGQIQARKRRIAVEDAASFCSDDQYHPSAQSQQSTKSSDFDMPGPSSRAISPSRGNMTLPSLHNPRAEDDDENALAKRRRLDEAREDIAGYRSRDARRSDSYEASNGALSADRMMDRRSIGGSEEGYDASVPLARRRGDAAQAKASRLHIDTGYGADAGSSHGGAGAAQAPTIRSGEGGIRSSENAPRPSDASSHSNMSHSVKSAPPYKASFFEREHSAAGNAHYDPRGPGPELPALSSSRSGGNFNHASVHGGHSKQGQYYPSASSARYGARPDDVHAHDQPYDPHADYAASVRREGVPPPSAVASHAYRAAQQSGVTAGAPGSVQSGTPLTASRMGFVPQTATLPSPAYHTTQFFRNGNGGGAPPAHGVNGVNGGGGLPQQPPRTAGLNPPMTARLPDHLRSPPSSKTQFLSLFSNFYDSLQDSRTLKATLEDQVRRSNTLLQTLQRSARVLELTVERRLTAERSQWESKVHALEERCRRLERKTGTGSPTPTPMDAEQEQAGPTEGVAEKVKEAESHPSDEGEAVADDAKADETMTNVDQRRSSTTSSPPQRQDDAEKDVDKEDS